MVTIEDCPYKSTTTTTATQPIIGKSTEPQLEMNGVKNASSSVSSKPQTPAASIAVAVAGADDVPLLVSDNEDYSDNESLSSRESFKNEQNSLAVESVKRDMKKPSPPSGKEPSPVESNSSNVTAPVGILKKKIPLTSEQFINERTQLMTIVVKYLATKINNSFPPESTKHASTKELPLDKFMLVLTSRLNLSLNSFMQGMIYLFRYMDVVYLLRYLNQSNNFANYNEMQFSVKKLIIGCFKITLTNDKINKDWCGITGLDKHELDSIVDVLTTRMNGKLSIKQIEILKMKSEIFRFVKMVTKAI